MNLVQVLLIAWISLTFISILIGLFGYYFRKNKIKRLALVEFINIAIASATIISSFSLIYRVITSEELLNLLKFDIYALLLGAIAVIWLSIQQILSIFK